MSKIKNVVASEILDSRGNPTVMVRVILDTEVCACACVPSGASTGQREAVELRDDDKKRYGGKGVLKAVRNVNEIIAPELREKSSELQCELDELLCKLDGTKNKSNLGANAILGASMAVCRAAALDLEVPLYQYIGELHGAKKDWLLPVPMMNVLNGGAHAANNLDFQEFMLYPSGAPSFAEALRYGAETFHALKKLLSQKGLVTAVGDEGGFAPDLATNDAAIEIILEAIKSAGFKTGKQVSIALDPAASELFENGRYIFKKSGGAEKTYEELIDLYAGWIKSFPIASLEDGMGEEDDEGWLVLTQKLGKKVQLVGDDNFVTNPAIFSKGIQKGIANAILIKLNQIGTVSETLETIGIAQMAGYGTVISHRSGETEDSFIADFAVGTRAGQIKTGSLCRSERIAKYNRLLVIEQALGRKGHYAGLDRPTRKK